MAKDKYMQTLQANNTALAKQLSYERAQHEKTLRSLNVANGELTAERRKSVELQKQMDAMRLDFDKNLQFLMGKLGSSAKCLTDIVEHLNHSGILIVKNETSLSVQHPKVATPNCRRRKSSSEFAMPKIEEEGQTTLRNNDDSASRTFITPTTNMVVSTPIASTSASAFHTTSDVSMVTNDGLASCTIQGPVSIVESTPKAGTSASTLCKTTEMSMVSNNNNTASRTITEAVTMGATTQISNTSASTLYTATDMSIAANNETASHTITKPASIDSSTQIAGSSSSTFYTTTEMSIESKNDTASRTITEPTSINSSTQIAGTSASTLCTTTDMSLAAKEKSTSQSITEPDDMEIVSVTSVASTTSAPTSTLSTTDTDPQNMSIVTRPFIDLMEATNSSMEWDPLEVPMPIPEIKNEPKSPLPTSTAGPSDANECREKSARIAKKVKEAAVAPTERTFNVKPINTRKKAANEKKAKSLNDLPNQVDPAGDEVEGRTRRKRKPVDYKEPPLNTKMRRTLSWAWAYCPRKWIVIRCQLGQTLLCILKLEL